MLRRISIGDWRGGTVSQLGAADRDEASPEFGIAVAAA
jgi:hypothetical protein